jgi:CRISPR-associated DxTHG motif protein
MQLITVLGIGRYEETCYTWQGKDYRTRFVAKALCHFFEPNVVKVLVTKEARDTHWENLKDSLGDEITVTPVPIPSGRSETEIWEIFDAVVDSVEANSEIIFDITHSWRSIPMFVLLASAFLRKAKNVDIQGVYYGAWDREQPKAPILDLTPTIKLLDWLTATDKFIATGSSVELAKILSGIQRELHQQQAETKPTRLINLSGNIKAISESIDLVRSKDLIEQAAKLQRMSSQDIKSELGIFAKPFELLFEQIQDDYGQFALNESEIQDDTLILQKQFLLIRWYVVKGFSGQAILLSREWLISSLVVSEGIPYSNKGEREDITSQLGAMIGEKRDLQQPIARHTNADNLSAIWSKITQYRNDVAHVGERPNPASAATLHRYVKENLINDLSGVFPQFAS